MALCRHGYAVVLLLLGTSAWAQEDIAAYLPLKSYFIGDTNTVMVPHTTCDLLVGPVADSVSYNGTWRADKPALCRTLMEEAAKHERSVLFNLRFVGDNVNVGMITHLGRTIVDAHNSAAIDTAITKCFIHVQLPPSPVPPAKERTPR